MMMMCRFLFVLLLLPAVSFAMDRARFVTPEPPPGGFAVVSGKSAAAIFVERGDHAGVVRAAKDLQADIARVTGVTPQLVHDEAELRSSAIIVGTIGKSGLIDRLIVAGKVDASNVAGQ